MFAKLAALACVLALASAENLGLGLGVGTNYINPGVIGHGSPIIGSGYGIPLIGGISTYGAGIGHGIVPQPIVGTIGAHQPVYGSIGAHQPNIGSIGQPSIIRGPPVITPPQTYIGSSYGHGQVASSIGRTYASPIARPIIGSIGHSGIATQGIYGAPGPYGISNGIIGRSQGIVNPYGW